MVVADGDSFALTRLAEGIPQVVCGRVVNGRSFWQRFRGLMGRPPLDPDEGLYLPTSSIHMLFMRFPIDALFVSRPGADGGRRVVAAHHGLPAWRGLVLPVRGAQGVVEMPAGTLRRAGLQPGDTVRFEPAAGGAAGAAGAA